MTETAPHVPNPLSMVRTWIRDLAPFWVLLLGGAVGYVMNAVQVEAASKVDLANIKADVAALQEQSRRMPAAEQIVTKAQFDEVIKRLDERTEAISQDVKYLRDREEMRAER